MSMLPRLRPRCFYDLVVEVALVRPGPIQGGMVHPYLLLPRQRGGELSGRGWSGRWGRTLGVPIFQEQVMQIVQDAAGLSQARRTSCGAVVAAWRRKGNVQRFQDRIVQRHDRAWL